jgi:hypothetical protein
MTPSTLAKPDYARYLESAKRAELGEELRQEGFSVETDKVFDDVQFDLIATREGKTKAFELRSVGNWKFDRESLRRLRDKARAEGFEFHIVIVNPPPRVNVEIDDFASQLHHYLINNPLDELESLSTHTSISGVYDLSISDIHVGKGEIRVAGVGTVEVELQYGSDSDAVPPAGDSYLFRFKAILNAMGHLQDVEEISVDTSTFYDQGDL